MENDIPKTTLPLVRIGEPCPDGPHRHTSSLHQTECDIRREAEIHDQPQTNAIVGKPRPITREVLDEFMAWTRNAPMFLSSPQGLVFGKEMREALNLAYETLENRDAG